MWRALSAYAEYAPAMVRRTLAAGFLVASTLLFWGSGTADAKNTCLLDRAFQSGNAVQTPIGTVYKPYLPTAEDYEACGLAVGATPVVAAPGFTG